jgi:hypothetical protein
LRPPSRRPSGHTHTADRPANRSPSLLYQLRECIFVQLKLCEPTNTQELVQFLVGARQDALTV